MIFYLESSQIIDEEIRNKTKHRYALKKLLFFRGI